MSSSSDSPLINGRYSATPEATPAEVRRLAREWTQEQKECRIWGHPWLPSRCTWNTKYRYYYIVRRCPNCGSEQITEMLESGEITARGINYGDGYLAQGVGRITGAGKAALRVDVVTGSFVVDQVRGKKASEVTPRKGTRDAIDEAA